MLAGLKQDAAQGAKFDTCGRCRHPINAISLAIMQEAIVDAHARATEKSFEAGSANTRRWVVAICLLHVLSVWFLDYRQPHVSDAQPPWFFLDSAKWMGVGAVVWIAIRTPASSAARIRWRLLLVGYIFGSVAVLLYGLRLLYPPDHTVSIGVPALLFVLAAVPFLLAITSEFNPRETPAVRRLALLQAALLTALFITLVPSLVRFTGEVEVVGGVVLNWILASQGVILATGATLRLVGSTDEEEKRFFFLLSITMWIALVVSTIRNSLTLVRNATFWDVVLDAQFLVIFIMILAVYRPPAWLSRFRPSKALLHITKISNSLVEGLVLVAIGIAVARYHFVIGSIGIALAIAIYGWRNALIQASLEEAEESLLALNGELRGLVILDGLTGIPNRRAFDLALEREANLSSRTRYPIGLLMIDIDHFKVLNDTYGHEEGDRCLRLVARALMNAVTRSRDFLGRYGGEEFSGIFPGIHMSGLEEVSQRLCDAVHALELPHPNSPTGHVTISVGAVLGIASGMKPLHDLVLQADDALYLAKRHGRDRYLCKDMTTLNASKTV